MSLKKSLAWMGIAQAAGFLFQFASSVVLARYLSPEDLGVFAVGVATVLVLALLQSFGLQPLIVREEVLTPSIRSTAFTVNALIAFVQSGATIACAFLGAKFLGHQGVKHVLLVLSIVPLLGIFSFLPGAELERHARFKATAIVTLITSFIGAAATIVFALMGFRYMSLAYAQVISAAALAIGFVVVGREYSGWGVSFGEWRRISNFGFQMFAYSGLVNFSQRFCEIMLGRIAGLASLGLYNRASSINNMLWANIHYLASRVVLVDFATLHRSASPLKARYLQALAMITATLWPAFAGLAVVAGPFIVIVYGAKWSGAITPLAFLCIASIIQVSMTMSWELFTVTGNISTQTRLELLRAVVSVPLFVGACFVSINLVAFTRVIDALVAFLLYRPHLDRMANTNLTDVGGIYLESAILTLIAVAPSSCVMLWFANSQAPLPYVIVTIFLGVLLWIFALFWMRHPLAQEVLRTLTPYMPMEKRRRLSLHASRSELDEQEIGDG